MADIDTDFCIVGGGPAGLTLALLLLRSGARVAVVEKSRSLDREYRGEILQPGGQRMLAELGVLAGIRERGACELDRFVLEEHGKVLINADYRTLPGPYNHLLSVPQRNLLAALLDACHEHDAFTYLASTKVGELVRDTSRIRGVVCGDTVVRAHCVVGADGRYSKVRTLAGIENNRLDVFQQDVLWFKLAQEDAPRDVRVFRAGGNPIMAYASADGGVQFGWTLPHKGYRALADQGFDHVKAQLRAAVPAHAEQIDAQLTGFRDLTLLDVFSGTAADWVRDGLLLIGDAAHTHSPIGAQGINLAIQDAVAAHPVLMDSLRARDASAGFLGRFVTARKPDIDRMMKIQVLQSKAMLSTGRIAGVVRPKMASIVSRTPLYRIMLRHIAFGNQDIGVRTELFAA